MISATSSRRSESPQCPEALVPGLEGIQKQDFTLAFSPNDFFKGFHHEILNCLKIDEAGMGEAMAVG